MLTGKNYQSWKISFGDFPKQAKIEDQIKFITRFGILAPSIHNTQPWLFEIAGNTLIISPNWGYYLARSDPAYTALTFSLGCCAANIESAASYIGFTTSTAFSQDQGKPQSIVMKFQKTNKKDKLLSQLAQSITKRYSNKLMYNSRPIPARDLKEIEKLAYKNTSVTVTPNQDLISKIVDLHTQAMKVVPRDFTTELSEWLRDNSGSSDDGMPGFTVGFGHLQSKIGKSFIKNFPLALKIMSKKDRSLLNSSAAVGVIYNSKDDLNGSFESGILYERVALLATSMGISMTPMFAVLSNEGTKSELEKLISLDKKSQAQCFFRMGYTSNNPYHSPRRDPDRFYPESSTENKLKKSLEIDSKLHQIEISGFSINYLVAGKGEPLLLLHGGNLGWGQWYPNIPSFAKKYKVYAIDLVGGGRSTKIDYSTLNPDKHFVEVVEKFINKMGLKKVNLIGSSFGGWIATTIAVKHPDKVSKLILVDTVGFSNYYRPQDKIIGFYPFAKFLSRTALKPDRSNKNVEGFLRSVFASPKSHLSEEFLNYFYETMQSSHNLLFISQLAGNRLRDKMDLSNKLPKIKAKSLIVWGKEDKLMPLDKFSQNFTLIPNVEIKIIEGVGHFPSLEKSKDFNSFVLDFLNSK